MGNWLKKLLAIFRATWENTFAYRLNFLVWRIRSVVQLLSLYFFWLAVYRFNHEVVGYDQRRMLTYIIGTSIMASLVIASRTNDIGGEIGSGELSRTLLKPVNYFSYWLSKDVADKALNLLFVFLETGLILLVLRPPVIIQTDPVYLAGFGLVALLSIFVYFYLSIIISLTTFWYPEHNGWPARFLSMVSIQFLSGGIMPLDILPDSIFRVLEYLPFTYFIFFPLKVYLGKVGLPAIARGMAVALVWIIILRGLARFIWRQGLKKYTAAGI